MPKTSLPLTYVLHARGYEPEEYKGNDILYRVPWRDDSDPSLALYKSDDTGVVDKFRDMARAEGQGDVFDLIFKLDPNRDTFPLQVEMAERLLESYQASGWTAPEPVASRATLDIEAYREEQKQYAVDHDGGSLAEWLMARNDYVANIDAGWLTRTFGVTWSGGQMHIPYLDADGVIQTGKYRKPGEKIHSIAGSRGTYNFFYGEHLDTDHTKTLVVCEGEPDVWSGTCAAREDYVFLGLPTGAGYSEKLASRLAGRTVLLALDADPAGREALVRWMEGLDGVAASVAMILLPDGKDLSDMLDIRAALSRPVAPVVALSSIMEIGGMYRQTTANGNPGAPASDFLMTVERVMQDDEGALHFEVSINGRVHDLRSWDLRNKTSMRAWASARGHTWLGSDTAVAMLENHLKVQAMWVPRIQGVHAAGLHDGHFVWPGGMIGERDLKWVPGPIEGFKAQDFKLKKAPQDRDMLRDTLSVLLRLNAPHSVHPILAWLAAAPLRSQLPEFPILNIAGIAGTGKTATIETLVRTWSGFDRYLGLGTAPTRYAMTSLIAGGNAFPVALDEYRPSGRMFGDSAITDANDIIRAAYNGQTRETGGFPGDVQRKIELEQSSPLIVSGESTLDEKSLRERAVLVRLQAEGRDVAAMSAFKALPADGRFAYVWLQYLLSNRDGEAAVLRSVPAGPESLSPRPRHNLGVLEAGWDMILRFVEDYRLDVDIPGAPDLSAVIAEYNEAEVDSVLADAIESVYALDRPRNGESVMVENGDVCVKLAPFVAEATALGFNLSGSANAVAKQMAEMFGAVSERRRDSMGRQARVQVFSAHHIFGNEVE